MCLFRRHDLIRIDGPDTLQEQTVLRITGDDNRIAGTITQDTLLTELANGDVLSEDFDIEEEIEATQTGGLIEMQQPEPTPPAAEEATMLEAEPEAEDELAG